MSAAIKIENLSKKYVIRHVQQPNYSTLRDAIAATPSKLIQVMKHPLGGHDHGDGGFEEFWALNDISLEVQPGERVGIVGRNGAGKSTLLKMLSRISEPTKGRIELLGRVASLLEVGTGFHPELTGRENIYLNGAILGMSKAEIRGNFDSIVDFSEVEKFLDTPVKRYSSGMSVRLAFSVAAHLRSDILIVDEVLAVGDIGFQKKCMSRMESVAREGRTVLFVSHNMGAISELCSRAVLLDHGCKLDDGPVKGVIANYSRMFAAGGGRYQGNAERSLAKECTISDVCVLNEDNQDTGIFDINEPVIIEVQYVVNERLQGLQLALTLSRNMVDIFHTYDTDTIGLKEWVSEGVYLARHRVPGMFLKAGSYRVSLNLGTPTKLIEELTSVVQFDVEESSINTQGKAFRKDRPGHVISPGVWQEKNTNGR